MNLRTLKHEDDRRTLVEWISDIPVRSLKTIHVKKKCSLGNHYHEKKDEIFYMMKGKGVLTLTTPLTHTRQWLFDGDCVLVPRNTIHTFTLYPDSILLEAATAPYDPSDEIRA